MIRNIRFRVFVYKDENQEDLIEAIYNILPEANVEVEEAEGLFEDKIIILSGIVKKKKHTKDFFNKLSSLDNNKLIASLPNKIDDNGNLFLRFSKEDAICERWNIVDSGDCIHLKVKIAAYPAKKEVAINKITDALSS